MDKKFKLSYDPPKIVSVSFRVENGLQASLTLNPLTPLGDATWDAPSASSSTSHFGNGDWTGSSSSSSNSTFGSGSWD